MMMRVRGSRRRTAAASSHYPVLTVMIVLAILLACFLQSTFTIFYSLGAGVDMIEESSSSSRPFLAADDPPPRQRQQQRQQHPTTRPSVANTNRIDDVYYESTKRNRHGKQHQEEHPAQRLLEIEPRWSTMNTTKPGIHIFSNRIDVIRIIGERHSGTTFFERHLQNCFSQSTDIGVVSYFVRKKHWFQPTPDEIMDTCHRYGPNGLNSTKFDDSNYNLNPFSKSWWEIANPKDGSSDPKHAFNTSLVLFLVRNPYDWIEAMRLKPHHWPNHVDLIPINSTVPLKRVEYSNKNNNNNIKPPKEEQGEGDEIGGGTVERGGYQHDGPTGMRRRRLMDTSMLRYRHRKANPTTGKTGYRQQPQQQQRNKPSFTIEDTPQGTNFGDQNIPSGYSLHKSYFTKSTLDWKEFIRRPMHVQENDDYLLLHNLNPTADTAHSSTPPLCQKGYEYGTISPCLRNISYIPASVRHIPKSFLRKLPFDINDVVYEQRRRPRQSPQKQGQKTTASSLPIIPYNHPMELRGDKIHNFLQIVQNWDVGGFGVIRYEDLVGANRLHDVVIQISNKLKIAISATGDSRQCQQSDDDTEESHHEARREIPNEFKHWITNHTDWNLEAVVGYFPEN